MFFMFSENLSVVLGTCIFKKILKLFLLPFFNLRMVPSGFSLRIRNEERHEVEVVCMGLFFQILLATTFFDAFYDTGISKKI